MNPQPLYYVGQAPEVTTAALIVFWSLVALVAYLITTNIYRLVRQYAEEEKARRAQHSAGR